MAVKYPGLSHADYEATDPEFAAFMRCRSHELLDVQVLPPSLCSNA
jgi:hypothetical protein